MIVATAGHIDHGKTSLVKAITSVDTDRLPDEKARSISIDLGFAYWTPPGVSTIGFIDVPGHERFVRNMVCGVGAVDFIMLVVAADDGPMPQTLEHLHIVDLLGANRGAIVISKADRVSAERLRKVSSDVQRLVNRTGLEGAQIMAVSAVRGDGVDAIKRHLCSAAAEHLKRQHTGRYFRHTVDRVFTVAGIGTVATGAVLSGSVAVGDRLLISPSGAEVRVRAIQQHGCAVNRANAGERCALNLAGIKHRDVGRGDWIVDPTVHAPTDRLDARLRVLPQETQPLKHWTPVHIHVGSADVPARLAMRRGGSVAPGDAALVQLRLDRTVACLRGDRFIVRDQSATRTLGGGTVLDPFAFAGGGSLRQEPSFSKALSGPTRPMLFRRCCRSVQRVLILDG